MLKTIYFLVCTMFLLQEVRLIGSFKDNFKTKLNEDLTLIHTFPQEISFIKKHEEKYLNSDLSSKLLDKILDFTEIRVLKEIIRKNATVDMTDEQTFILNGAYLLPSRNLIAIHNTNKKTIDIYSTNKDNRPPIEITLHPTLIMSSFFLDFYPDKKDTENEEEDRLLIFYNAKNGDQIIAAISICNSINPNWATLPAGSKPSALKDGMMPIDFYPGYSIWDMQFIPDKDKKDLDKTGQYGLCETGSPNWFGYYKPITIFAASFLGLIILYYTFLR